MGGNMLHEMLIVLGKENYIRPHRHPSKSESFHVIEGRADIVLFDEAGTPIKRIELGDYSSGRRFYFRIDRPIFHTVVVMSARFVFHETTNGPFNRKDTEFALWGPEETDVSGGSLFLSNSLQQIGVSHDS
jgi:cupin fold WbuC family metalloprotein